jgi:hypothetical protein
VGRQEVGFRVALEPKQFARIGQIDDSVEFGSSLVDGHIPSSGAPESYKP